MSIPPPNCLQVSKRTSARFTTRFLKPILLVAILGISGCTTPTFTHPTRSGIEQLLLSNAVDNALKGMKLTELSGKKVFFDATYLDSYDVKYVKGAIRARISDSGAMLVPKIEDAEIVVEPRCGGLGIDPSKSLLGIPSLPVPVPSVTTIVTPELVLYSASKMDAVTTIALLAYDVNGEQVLSSVPVVGKSHFYNYRMLLLINLNFTDLEARKSY